jgi:hypothetical protein
MRVLWQRKYNIAGTLHQPGSMAGRAVACEVCGVERVVILLERRLGEILFLLLSGREGRETPQSANTFPAHVSVL